ncbi:glycosyl hydrolase family 28-related protein [Microlunatus sp. Y2014]|uniref:glycosyl hydrolase family 28-related protein n=1 Tax=Microlunatus sp. Y2014 TaxID=3418488 RepID=UPI003DA76FED
MINRRQFAIGTAALSVGAATALSGQGMVAQAKPRIATPVPPTLPTFPPATYHVADFGAMPSDGQDDTLTIQAAIDAAASNGGGTVRLDPGTYDLSIITHGTEREDRTSLRMRSGVRLMGAGQGRTVLRLADSQGNYWAIFDSDRHAVTTDIGLSDFTLDQNTTGNPITAASDIYGDPIQPRYVARFYEGGRVLVERSTFTDLSSGNTLSFNPFNSDQPPSITDVMVRSNRFTDVGGGTVDFDHSTIYTRGDRMAVIGNEFVSRHGAGTLNARTAIEIHNSDQTITDNRVTGYAKAMNVTGYGLTNHRQLVARNTMTDVGMGMYVWSQQRTVPMEPLRDVEIADNTITINVDGWNQSRVGVVSAGILGHPGNNTLMTDIWIHDNTVTYVNDAITRDDRTKLYDSMAAGVGFWNYERFPVQNITITDNEITNPLSAGVWTNTAIIGTSTIQGNVITNPGRNNRLDKVWPEPLTVPYQAWYRSGIALDVDASSLLGTRRAGKLTVKDNRVILTDTTIDVHAGVTSTNSWLRTALAIGNSLTGSDAPLSDLGFGWRGSNV